MEKVTNHTTKDTIESLQLFSFQYCSAIIEIFNLVCQVGIRLKFQLFRRFPQNFLLS